ncbi:hypothetical protein G9A89_023664 [Geosiphon pyriformis]|nr:hypothetical protein G9A89_023664 [Geosiphon pyriformis]
MRQGLILVFFLMTFALTALALPNTQRKHRKHRFGNKKQVQNTSPATLTKSAASPILTKSAASPILTKSAASPILTKSAASPILTKSVTSPILTKSVTSTSSRVTSQASPAPTQTQTQTPPINNNNNNNNNDFLSGGPSGKVCDVSKLPATNGEQKTGGSCSNTQLGEIPSVDKMVSSLITSPGNGATLSANKPFTVTVVTSNLITGNFDDPNKEYYLFSQQLNKDGFVKGHQHVTVQELSSNGRPPSAKEVKFFKGLNNPANNNGELSVVVDTPLGPGTYRICTMSSSFGHQPLLMTVARRGAQDDCIRVTMK